MLIRLSICAALLLVPGSFAQICLPQDADCNGVDDDCDGRIDEDFGGVTLCGVGECAGNSGLAECAPVEIWGSNRLGDLYRVDLGNRVDAFDGTLDFGTQAMDLDYATGRIYYYEYLTSGDRFGYFDPATGENVLVRSYQPALGIYAKRMAQAPDGTMYLGDQNNNLLTIDLASGDVAYVGTIQGLEIGAFGATGDFAFAPDGTLWAVNYQAIATIDLTTLVATEIADDLIDLPGINIFTGAAWCHGSLYAAAVIELTGVSAFFRFDPADGSVEALWSSIDYLNDLSSCAADGSPPAASDSCDPFGGATPEICNGVDDDCDGETDEGDVCGARCIHDSDCDDGSFCNGAESCDLTSGACLPGSAPCTSCDEENDSCLTPIDGATLFLSFEQASSFPWTLGAADCSAGDDVAEAFGPSPSFVTQNCRTARCLRVRNRQALQLDAAGIVDAEAGSWSFHFRVANWRNGVTLMLATDLANDGMGAGLTDGEELNALWVDDQSAASSTRSTDCALETQSWYWATCDYDRDSGIDCSIHERDASGWSERCSWSGSDPLPALDLPLLGVGNLSGLAGASYLLDDVVFAPAGFDHGQVRDLRAATPGLCDP